MFTTPITINGWQNILTGLRTAGYTGPAIVSSAYFSNQSATDAYLHLTQNGATAPSTASDGILFDTDGTAILERRNIDLATTWVNTAGSIAIRVQVTR